MFSRPCLPRPWLAPGDLHVFMEFPRRGGSSGGPDSDGGLCLRTVGWQGWQRSFRKRTDRSLGSVSCLQALASKGAPEGLFP